MQDQLSTKPYHVLHYMGHGAIDTKTGVGALILEDEDGNFSDYVELEYEEIFVDKARSYDFASRVDWQH